MMILLFSQKSQHSALLHGCIAYEWCGQKQLVYWKIAPLFPENMVAKYVAWFDTQCSNREKRE